MLYSGQVGVVHIGVVHIGVVHIGVVHIGVVHRCSLCVESYCNLPDTSTSFSPLPILIS